MGLGDDHQATGDRGGFRAAVGHGGQVGGHGLIVGRQGGGTARLAKAEKIAPAGGVGADRGRRFALPGVGVGPLGRISQVCQRAGRLSSGLYRPCIGLSRA